MIPQVNAGATDRNREQTKRICELKGLEYPKDWRIKGGDTVFLRHLKAFEGLHQAGIADLRLRTGANHEGYICLFWRKDTGVSLWNTEKVYPEDICKALADLLYKLMEAK